MARLQLNTAHISSELVLGEFTGVVKPGSSVNTRNGFGSSLTGGVRLAPPAATLNGGSGLTLQGHELQTHVRQLGSTVYVYDSLMSSYDGGRSWRRSKLPNGQTLYPTSTVLESGGPSRASPFTKLIESVNAAQSIHEVGATTVDGQQVSEFTAVVPFPKLLIDNPLSGPKPGPHTHLGEAERSATVELDLFIAPTGLPVRTIVTLGGRRKGTTEALDILAINIPFVAPSPPPAGKTISEAALRRLQRKRRG
jgi:hypothetical protein